MSDREAFLAGERPEDVLMFFADDAVTDADALADLGERVDDGVVLVVEGGRGRSAFERATGRDPMAFAKEAMGTEGTVWPDCTGGDCPAAGEVAEDGDDTDADDSGGDDADVDESHRARFVFAFAEAQNEEVGGLYAEGDVVHAYVDCSCGTAYSDKWVAGER